MRKMRYLTLFAGIVLPAVGSAQTFTTLYTFPPNGKAGLQPIGTLIAKGNTLYGTTYSGGASNGGTVFKINTATGAEKVLHSFAGGSDGSQPRNGVIYLNNVLWGTTNSGGGAGLGTVYKLDLQTGTESIAYMFQGGSDGANPQGALLAVDGILYGTTQAGGLNKQGTVFKIDPNTGEETVLCSLGGKAAYPYGALISYKTLFYGVASGARSHKTYTGAAFSVDPTAGTATVLHVFGRDGDGVSPTGPLLLDGHTFYGTTVAGGASHDGTVFKLDPDNGSESVLHSFQGKDGAFPQAAVISQGSTLYGTASNGDGNAKFGVVFAFDTSTNVETVLHDFTNGIDGSRPGSALVASAGSFYGTTIGNFNSKKGSTVFKITP